MPRYVQFPRSNVAGNTPTRIDPGSFAVNWADRKIFTGGPSGEPILMAYRLSDFDSNRSYRLEDIMYRDGSLWRCKVSFASGGFNESQWEELTDNTTAPYKELSGTVWLSGGTLSINGNEVDVTSGSGVVMDLSMPASPVVSPVSWPNQTLSYPQAFNQTVLVGVDGNGSLVLINDEDEGPEWRRQHITLGWITTDSTGAPVTADNIGVTQHQTKETLSDLLNILGPFKVEGVDINLSGPSQLRLEGGEVFWQGLDPLTDSPNIVPVSTIQPFPVRLASRNGYESTALITVMDPSKWDDGGVVSVTPAGKFTTQFVFMTSDRGEGLALYGQKTYDTLDAALSDVPAAWLELERPEITDRLLVLGAVCTDDTGSSQSVINASSGVDEPFVGGGSGGGDTSQFLLISGVRAMTGNLDLGGNELVNGIVDGDGVDILPITYSLTGENGAAHPGELNVNAADEKVFIGGQPVADRVQLYSDTLAYQIGDKTIENNNLYYCTTDILVPEAFNPANWQLIGADNSGALTQAVIVAPDAPDRNTIDVTGQGGGVAALKTTFANDQSVDLYEFSPNARISRFGIPTNAFGEDVFRVSQVSHIFTAVGTAVYFDGAVWALADDGDPSRYPQALIHEIIDTDNFLLQIGGRINNLDPTAFVGNAAPTPGQFYYASDQAGKLTGVEGPTPIPCIYAISATQGLVKLTGTRQPYIPTEEFIVDLIYPVGSLYVSVDPANPSIRWPATTWVADSVGRALVGVGDNGESIWSVGDTRGSETHTLTVDEIPGHDHDNVVPQGTTDSNTHSHRVYYENEAQGGGSQDTVGTQSNNNGNKDTNNNTHSHVVDIPAFTSEETGGGGAHDNVQPSIARYIWRRTG